MLHRSEKVSQLQVPYQSYTSCDWRVILYLLKIPDDGMLLLAMHDWYHKPRSCVLEQGDMSVVYSVKHEDVCTWQRDGSFTWYLLRIFSTQAPRSILGNPSRHFCSSGRYAIGRCKALAIVRSKLSVSNPYMQSFRLSHGWSIARTFSVVLSQSSRARQWDPNHCSTALFLLSLRCLGRR